MDNEINNNLNNLLEEALNSELKAKKFYEEAYKKAESETGKKLFLELAEFEEQQRMYEEIEKNK